MSHKISLKDAERKVFITATNDGLWDIFLACIFLMFIIALYLAPSLGDFWSSALFIPYLTLVYLAIWLVRKYVVTPRIGRVQFGQVRKTRLAKFSTVMLIVNILAFILGLAAAIWFESVPGQVISMIFGLTLLTGFSAAAYFLDIGRLYFYGLLAGFAPLVGEWFWSQGYADHHGFPVTFGALAGLTFMVGLVIFARFLHDNPLPAGENTI